MIFTGIQGATSRYDLEMTDKGLMVTDTKTGNRIPAVLARKNKNSQEGRWLIWNEKKEFLLAQKQYVLPQKENTDATPYRGAI